MSTENIVPNVAVWRTDSDLRWTFVAAPSLCQGLVQLARVLDDFGLEEYVTNLHMEIDDEGFVTVGALTERLLDDTELPPSLAQVIPLFPDAS